MNHKVDVSLNPNKINSSLGAMSEGTFSNDAGHIFMFVSENKYLSHILIKVPK